MPSTMQEKINDLLMKELSGFFDKLIMDMETDENEEGFTRDTIMKSAEEYFNVNKSVKSVKSVKPKVIKEKKQIDPEEQCAAIKKDGSQCSKKRTNKVEYQGTEIENLCTSHITIYLKNKTEVVEIQHDSNMSNVDEIDPPFETEVPVKKSKKSKKETKEIIEEELL